MNLAGNSGKSLPLHGVLAVKIMPDFGALRENEAAFEVAVASITSGESEWGRSILAALRDHICSTGEQKSVQWILPKVLEILEARKICPLIPPSHRNLSTSRLRRRLLTITYWYRWIRSQRCPTVLSRTSSVVTPIPTMSKSTSKSNESTRKAEKSNEAHSTAMVRTFAWRGMPLRSFMVVMYAPRYLLLMSQRCRV